MKIDRSRFLLLAAAISANACTVIDARGQGDTGLADDSATVADSTTDDVATDATTDSGADTTVADGADTAPAADGSADAPGDAASGDAAHIDASDAPACTNEGFTVPACDLGDAGCSVEVAACTSWTTYLKSKQAKKAVECLVALPTCEGADTASCVKAAFDDVCLDEDVTTFCNALVGACVTDDAGTTDAGSDTATDAASDAAPTNTPTQMLADCKKYAPGLLSAGRTRLQVVASTVDEGRCTVPLRDLLGQL